MPTVAVVGGSLGGITAALVLADVGCDVTVYERSPSRLEARGAGIAVLDETVRWFAERTDTDPEEVCSATRWIRFLGPCGETVHERDHRYRFSSWNTIYRALLAYLPAERYRLGCEVTGITWKADGVAFELGTGERGRVDLLVAADGIGSPTRAALMPEVMPRYAGYVAWRGTMREADLTPATFAAIRNAITYQVLEHSHVLAYPIPGPDGALAPGRRLVNFVWYRNVAEGTAKAAADGWVLAEQLAATGGDVDAALRAWETSQLALGRELLRRSREIGDASQRLGAFVPGDLKLIFGLRGPGR